MLTKQGLERTILDAIDLAETFDDYRSGASSLCTEIAINFAIDVLNEMISDSHNNRDVKHFCILKIEKLQSLITKS